MGVAAVILAAGGGARFEGPTHKLLATHPARPATTVLGAVLGAALDARSAGALDEVLVVWGAVHLDGTPRLDEAVLVQHAEWSSGQAGSVRAGLRAAGDRGHTVAVLCPGDQVGVSAAAFITVAGHDGEVVAACYPADSVARQPRPPVRLARSRWGCVPESGDEGVRSLFRDPAIRVTLVDVPGSSFDIDTVEDLDRWN